MGRKKKVVEEKAGVEAIEPDVVITPKKIPVADQEFELMIDRVKGLSYGKALILKRAVDTQVAFTKRNQKSTMVHSR